jgi:hypothetical protein
MKRLPYNIVVEHEFMTVHCINKRTNLEIMYTMIGHGC